jgi:hypothetical protein
LQPTDDRLRPALPEKGAVLDIVVGAMYLVSPDMPKFLVAPMVSENKVQSLATFKSSSKFAPGGMSSMA